MIRVESSRQGQDISHLMQRVSDMRPFLGWAGEDLQGQFGEAFRTRGGSIGRPWPDLSPLYDRYKPAGAPGVFTGLLLRSLTTASGRYGVLMVSADRLQVGSRAPHAARFHRGRGGQPARPVVPGRQVVERRIARAAERWLTGSTRPFSGMV